MSAILGRYAYTPWGTLGALELAGEVLHTLEPPWRDNLPGISCIPEGEWPMGPRRYHHGGYDTWGIPDDAIPGRSRILFHAGNRVEDTRGCILVGLRAALRTDRLWLLESQRAHRRFMALLEGATSALLLVTRPEHLGRLTLPGPP